MSLNWFDSVRYATSKTINFSPISSDVSRLEVEMIIQLDDSEQLQCRIREKLQCNLNMYVRNELEFESVRISSTATF